MGEGIGQEVEAGELGRRRGRRRHIAVAIGGLFADVDIGVAEVLPHRDVVGEGVLEFVAREGLVAGEPVDRRIAGEGAGRDAAEGGRAHRALVGQEVGVAGRVVRVLPEHGQGGGAVRSVGQGGRDEATVEIDVVDLGATVAPEAGQAVGPGTALGHRPAEVEGPVGIAVVVHPDGDLMEGHEGRSLRDGVDEAARARAAVQRRGGAAQDVEALEAVGLDPERGEAGREELQAVEEVARVLSREAADLEPVVARVEAEGVGLNAGRVAQRFRHGFRLGIPDLLRAHDRDRSGRPVEARAGLRARRAFRGGEALHGTAGRLIGGAGLRRPLHVDGGELDGGLLGLCGVAGHQRRDGAARQQQRRPTSVSTTGCPTRRATVLHRSPNAADPIDHRSTLPTQQTLKCRGSVARQNRSRHREVVGSTK